MNKKVKKGLFISLSFFGILFVALLILPYAFRGKIMTLAKEQVNQKLMAKVDFDDFNLSFIRHFPNATIRLENLRIIGVGGFDKDTLLYSEKVDLVLNLKSLFKDNGYEIQKLYFSHSRVFAHVLPDGKANWNIMKTDSTQQKPDTLKSNFRLKLKDFEISHLDLVYLDDQGKMKAGLKNLNHTSSGDLTADRSLLKTHTSVDTLNYWMNGIRYIAKANAGVDADIDANLKDMIFTFRKNTSHINAIPFSFDGWVKILDSGYDMNLKLNAEKVDFKAILSMIPAIYSNSFEGVNAGGDVAMSGFIKGKMIGNNYPSFDFKLTVAKGWFQYPKLPKRLQNVTIITHIINPGKTLDATVIDISKFSFLMGGNLFTSQIHIAYPVSDPELILKAVGKINLGNIKEIYPLATDTRLSGILDMKLEAGGRMSNYDSNQYEKFKFDGNMNITDMLTKMSSQPQDISISKASMVFNNRYIDLRTLQMRIGRNDLSASGKLENFVAYVLHKKTLKGMLTLQSNYFNATDFMTGTTTKSGTGTSLTLIEIPKNIDFTLQAEFNRLVYGKMDFTKAKGMLRVLDGDLKFKNMGVQAFGGNMLMNGTYSTHNPEKPTVNFDLNINDVVFTEIFKQVETLQKIAPVFSSATGRFSAKLSFISLLKKNMMPDMGTLTGNGSFSTKSVGLSNVAVLTALASGLKHPELANPNIKDLGLDFAIKDGKVTTKPFNVSMGNIKMTMGGSTGLDKSIAYTGNVQLPDKFNLGQISNVVIKIGGTFSKPKVSLDMVGLMNNLFSGAKAKVTTEVNKQVDAVKTKALDEVNKQKENALKAAHEQADKIRSEAQQLSTRLISDARAQGDQLIAKAGNPFTKKVAEVAAKKLVDEATKKAADINTKAEIEAQKVLQQAGNL